MSNFINIVYSEDAKPYTKYPFRLCKHLFKKFNMEKGDKILDVGCGRGDFSKGFKDLGLEVFCLDKEIDCSGIRKELLMGIELQRCDVEKETFPYEDETFDFVFSKSLIEHLMSPDNFVKESYRVLKPNGKKIIMTPDWQSQRCIFFNDYTHVRPYMPKGLSDLLKIYNFSKVQVELFYQLPFLWKYPKLKIFSKFLQLFGPVKKIHKNKFIRWSRELMILGSGIKK